MAENLEQELPSPFHCSISSLYAATLSADSCGMVSVMPDLSGVQFSAMRGTASCYKCSG